MPLHIQKTIQKLHLFLSNDLRDALKADSQDNSYVIILFLVHLITIVSLFVTEGPIGHLILIYILIPVLFFPARFSWISFGSIKLPIPNKISMYNIFRNAILCRTPLFLVVVIYGANKAFLSYLYPEPLMGYLHIFFYYLLAPILGFTIATNRLAVDQPDFYYLFFRIVTPFVALNSLINFYYFFNNISSAASLGNYRLQSSFGAALGYNPNLDALIHSIFFIGFVITVINNKSSYGKFIAMATITILSCALVLEQSRGCTAAVIITLLYFFISQKIIIDIRLKLALVIICGLIGVYVFVILLDGGSIYLARPFYLRPEIWFKFFKIISENSFIGFGDRYIFAVPLSTGEIAPHPHSLVMSSLVRGGIIGVTSIIYILISSTFSAYKYAKYTRNPIPLCVFMTAGIAGIFDFDLKVWQSGWYLASYWLVIALTLGADTALKNAHRTKTYITALEL